MTQARASLVIRGGRIVDGTGAPAFTGDIAVADGKILAVGKDLAVRGDRELDARGLLVTPGWVDPHTHYDAQMLWDPYFSPSCANGVSTLITGNCGVGIAPVQPSMREYITDVCDAVENIPAAAIKDQVKWEWETFPEYLDALEKRKFACDCGVLIGHVPVRAWVMGDRANMPDRPGGRTTHPVTDDEISKMSKVVEEAVAAGALGMSSSRVGLHRDTKGVLIPGSLAEHKENKELAKGIIRGGGGVFELASEWGLYDDVAERDPKKQGEYWQGEWKWIRDIARMDKEKLSFTTGMGSGMDKEGAWAHRNMLKGMDKINEKGGNLMMTPMLRLGMLCFSLRSNIHPFVTSDRYWALHKASKGSLEALTASMKEPENRQTILVETRAGAKPPYHPNVGGFNISISNPDMIWPWSADTEPKPEDSLKQRAKREGKTVLDLAFDIVTNPNASHGGVLWKALYNYGNGDLEPLREMMEHDSVVPGFADGGAHMAVQCEATTPTTMLTHWVRDRTRGPKLPVEMVVKKQTSMCAKMMGLSDRGELRPGMKADLNVIDFEKLRVLPPEYRNDMPTGAGRWIQDVEGYVANVVSGEVTFENGKPTGALPGCLVRNPRSVGLKGSLRGSIPPAGEDLKVDDLDLTEHAVKLASAKGAGMSGVVRAANAGLKSRL